MVIAAGALWPGPPNGGVADADSGSAAGSTVHESGPHTMPKAAAGAVLTGLWVLITTFNHGGGRSIPTP